MDLDEAVSLSLVSIVFIKQRYICMDYEPRIDCRSLHEISMEQKHVTVS